MGGVLGESCEPCSMCLTQVWDLWSVLLQNEALSIFQRLPFAAAVLVALAFCVLCIRKGWLHRNRTANAEGKVVQHMGAAISIVLADRVDEPDDLATAQGGQLGSQQAAPPSEDLLIAIPRSSPAPSHAGQPAVAPTPATLLAPPPPHAPSTTSASGTQGSGSATGSTTMKGAASELGHPPKPLTSQPTVATTGTIPSGSPGTPPMSEPTASAASPGVCDTFIPRSTVSSIQLGPGQLEASRWVIMGHHDGCLV